MVELQLEPPQDHLIKRVDDPIYPCRVYEYENRIYPSVTSVLPILDEPNWYQKWVGRVGQVKADAITRIAGDRGSRLHLACQGFVCGHALAQSLLMPDDLYRFNLIKKELSKLERVRAVEYKLVCKKYQVAGTADLIAYCNGQLTIIDYKSSNKPKWEEAFGFFWIQTAFYAHAWNESHPEEPITQLGIIPVNDQEPFIKSRFSPLNYVKSSDLVEIRAAFREKYNM